MWDWSFERIRDRNVSASITLGTFAFLQSNAIPVSLSEQPSAALSLDANVDEARAAVGVLVKFSFVRRTVVSGADLETDGKDDYDPVRDLS